MNPTDLIDLTDAKDLLRAGHYDAALAKLKTLLNLYPNDEEIKQLVLRCTIANKNVGMAKPIQLPVSEVTITIKNPGCVAGILFMVILAAIMTAFFLIFYVFGFSLKIRSGLIQEYFAFLYLYL